jgi:hypothetical protein
MQPQLGAAEQRPPPSLQPIQFYSVEITPLADGRMAVGMSATTCESIDEGQFELVSMDLASVRAETIEEVLAVIREALTAATAARH